MLPFSNCVLPMFSIVSRGIVVGFIFNLPPPHWHLEQHRALSFYTRKFPLQPLASNNGSLCVCVCGIGTTGVKSQGIVWVVENELWLWPLESSFPFSCDILSTQNIHSRTSCLIDILKVGIQLALYTFCVFLSSRLYNYLIIWLRPKLCTIKAYQDGSWETAAKANSKAWECITSW